MITRRGFIGGLLAAPAIIKVAMLMPVKAWVEPIVAPANPIFTGALGQWNGVRVIERTAVAARAYRVSPVVIGREDRYVFFVPPSLMPELRKLSG